MVRLSDMTADDAAHRLSKDCPNIPGEPFVSGPPSKDRRVAIVTPAGMHRSADAAFDLSDLGYRVIPGGVQGTDLSMSHASVHFDRSGFQDDVNVVFPIHRLRELADAGEIGSIAGFHYSVMGAGWEPHEIEPTAQEMAALLHRDNVTAALLVPV